MRKGEPEFLLCRLPKQYIKINNRTEVMFEYYKLNLIVMENTFQEVKCRLKK